MASAGSSREIASDNPDAETNAEYLSTSNLTPTSPADGIETRTFHNFIGEDPHEYEAEVPSDEEPQIDGPRENSDLPDLYRYLRGLEQGDTDLENEREPPSLFNRPEHLDSYKNISALKYQLNGSEVPQYVNEFETQARDDVLMIANISLEEIQEEEKRMRDEHINFQQQEQERQAARKNELSRAETVTKKRVAKDNKEKRRQLARMVEIARQKEKLQTGLLQQSFERSENQLQNVLYKRKMEVKRMYGSLSTADGEYGGTKGKRWKLDWDKAPQPIQIKLMTLRGVRDKLPGGRYVMMVSLYNRLGGHVMHWSKLHGQQWGGATLPIIHDGNFYNSEMKVNQSLFTVLPSKPSLRPGMVIAFELYLLKGDVVNTDRVVAWGCFPVCDGSFEVIEGKYKTPMLRGEMDFRVDKHSEIEKIISSELDHWMCNTYFEIIRLPRYMAGQKEYEVELQFSSTLVNHPDRINLDGEEYKDSENPVLGSVWGSKSEIAATSASDLVSVGMTTTNKTSSMESLHHKYSDLEDDSVSVRSSKMATPRISKGRRPTRTRSIHSIQGKDIPAQNDSSESDEASIDEDDMFVIKKGKEEFEPAEDDLGLYYKRHLNNPVDIYTKKLYSMYPKGKSPVKRLKTKQTYAEELEQHTASVKSAFSEKGRVAEKGWKRVSYLSRMFLAELGLSQWASREFWAMLILFVFTFFLRIFLHYCGQYVYLLVLGIPINSFNFLPYTVRLNYQATLLHPMEEMIVVLLGPMTVFALFVLCVILCWICQLIMGMFPDIGCKFVLMLGLQSFFNPLFLTIVDLAQQNYNYNTLTTATPLADFVKLYWLFIRTQGSGLGGVFITVFLYLFVMFISASVLYMYFLRLHNNGRMLDIYWRLHSQIDDMFVPYDLEVSLHELEYICIKAEQWRGEEGARRKVAVYDYIWEEEEVEFAVFDEVVERVKNNKKREKTSHIAIHTLHTDGLRELYRHFLVLPDGAIVEVFGEMSYVPGLTKEVKKAINTGARKVEHLMEFGSKTSINTASRFHRSRSSTFTSSVATASKIQMKGKARRMSEELSSLHTPVTGRGVHLTVGPSSAQRLTVPVQGSKKEQ